ncbi:efflux transporter outer membrane subunit [Erwinia persicina]|uniref:efflux transporter outer membrane subunit n=1 Tax=Erwinia persicina TaxID=55211 RepID=UPI00177E60A9|nr:efflux transporter outer membrane subunit [Erwinia persicina]MBD8214485.1 efflux transporter outer membrane subunit [Erwinia persicina]
MNTLSQKVLFSLSALILLSGCTAVGPDYSPPLLPSAANFGGSVAGMGSGAVEIEWWKTFDDPALVILIQRSLAANHDIGIAVARLEEANAILRENRQNFLPLGGIESGYEHRRQSRTETSSGQTSQFDTYRIAVDSSWEIDLFGRVRRSVEMAQAQAGSREALLRHVQAGVAASVAATWFELRGVEAELAVVTDISQSQRESFRQTERSVKAGSASQFDQLRAEALLRNIEAAVPELERRRTASVNALAILLGEVPQDFKLPAAVPSTTQTHKTLVLRTLDVGDPASLLSRRADIAAAERSLAAATARVGIDTASLYPDVQIQGSIGLVAGSLNAMNDTSILSGFIGPIIRWSFLDTARVRAQIAASEARTKAALIVYDQTVLRALQETDDAFKAYDAANKTLELHQLESVAHSDAARLAQLRFSLGEGIYSDVLEAQKSDFISRRALAIAYTNQQLAIVSIYKALGGGWEICTAKNSDCSGAEGRQYSYVKN